jgi:hypothetical protein
MCSQADPDSSRALSAALFLKNYIVQKADGSSHLEYWIPAEEMAAFNQAIVGKIEIVAEFH